MKRWLFVVVCLLAACSPRTVYVPQGDVLPVEAQRVIDRATATAGAMATQAAFATATEQVARASATAQYLATSDHLRFQQTEQAMNATGTQASAVSTAASVAGTQAALYTQEAVSRNVQATGQALAALQAKEERQAASDRAFAEFLATVGRILIAALICLVLIRAVRMILETWVEIRTKEIKALSELMPRPFGQGHYAIFLPDENRVNVLPLPGQVALPPAGVIEHSEPPDLALEQHWVTALYLWLLHGNRDGFSRKRMVADGVVSEPGWNTLREVCETMGVVEGERVTYLTPPHTPDSVRDDLRAGRLSIPLPYCNQEPPLVVAYHTTPLVPLVNTTHHA